MSRKSVPFVFLNVAVSADGKLSPANRSFVPFGSDRDIDLLYILRAQADALIVGATTADQPGATFTVGGPKYERIREQNGLKPTHLRVIVSGSGSLRPEADLFQEASAPTIILTTERASASRRSELAKVADEVAIFGKETIDFRAALEWLRRQYGVRKLLSEGGGGLNAALFNEGLVNELYMTICPLILGGRTAPTLADGAGVERLEEATQLRLKSLKRVGDELFLCYSVRKKKE